MNNFRVIRERAQITQERLAAAIGVERSTIAKWETDQCQPRAEMFPLLAKVLNCTTDELFGIKKPPAPKEQT